MKSTFYLDPPILSFIAIFQFPPSHISVPRVPQILFPQSGCHTLISSGQFSHLSLPWRAIPLDNQIPPFLLHIHPFTPIPTTITPHIYAHIPQYPWARTWGSNNQSPGIGSRRTSPKSKTHYYLLSPIFLSHYFHFIAIYYKNPKFFIFQSQQSG